MDYISIISSFFASFFIFIMVAFVLIKDWRDRINRYYAAMASGAFGILFTMFLSYAFPDTVDLTRINRLTQMSTAVFFTMGVAMALVFPKRGKQVPFYIIFVTILPGFIMAVLVGFTDLAISSAYFENGVLKRDFKPFYSVYAVIVLLYLLITTVVFTVKYIREKVEIYKLQLRYLFMGGSFSVVSAAICSIILPRYFNYSRLYAIGPAIASFFFTYSLFYSVIAYNLMDIKTAIHKTAMYTIISMAIIIPIYAIIQFAGNKMFFLGDVPYYIIASLVVIVFVLFSYYIQPLIDRAFKRKQYTFENIVDNFIRDIEDVKDLDSIIQRTVDILIESLFLKNAFFIMLNEESRKYELIYLNGSSKDFQVQPAERTSALIRWFVKNQNFLYINRIYTDDRYFMDIRSEIAEFYEKNNVQLILPIYHERRVLGLLCLGEKDSLSGFSPSELEKLSYFQSKSNDFISSALTYKKAMKEQFISRTLGLSDLIVSKSIPYALPNLKSISFGAFIVPKYDTGTDYFDFIRPGNQGVGVICTDISGVGVNSALYSVVIRSAFQSCLNESPSTYMVMQKINSVLYEYTSGRGELVTAFYFYYDIKSMKLMYTNAGYPALEVFRVEKNNFDSLDTEGIPLGYDNTTSYGIGRTSLLKGDIGVLYSKTLVNSKNHKGEVFTLYKLRGIVSNNRVRHPSEIAEIIKKEYENFMGIASPASDIIVIVFKIM